MRTLFRGRRTAPLALTVTALLTAGSLVACSDNSDDSAPAADTKTVTDARGEVEIPADPQRVAAFDNRIFRVLQDWDIDLVSAPVSYTHLTLPTT